MKYKVLSGFAVAGVYYTAENESELSKFSHEELMPFIEAKCLVVVPEKEPAVVAAAPATTPSKKR